MNTTILQFLSSRDMIDFQLETSPCIEDYNLPQLTLTAKFTEAEIELAQGAYSAVVVGGRLNNPVETSAGKDDWSSQMK